MLNHGSIHRQQDRDLATLFANCLPNTLDTTVRAVNDTDAFVVTGAPAVYSMLTQIRAFQSNHDWTIPFEPRPDRRSFMMSDATGSYCLHMYNRGHRGHVAPGQRLPGQQATTPQ